MVLSPVGGVDENLSARKSGRGLCAHADPESENSGRERILNVWTPRDPVT
jgi:hypothetical protein